MIETKIVEFIKKHPNNWEDLLTKEPYSLKIKRRDGYIIFNYNTFGSDFTLPLVQEARGIIFHEADWKVCCFPFIKFFNYGESEAAKIDWKTAKVQEKEDGTIIKVWWDVDNKMRISTNGMIDAFEKIGVAKDYGSLFVDIMQKKYPKTWRELKSNLFSNFTFMFELCALSNRVVVEYKKPQIFFIGMRSMKYGNELHPEYFDFFEDIPRPKQYNNCSTLSECIQMISKWSNKEGLVAVDDEFNRVKIKTDWWFNHHYLSEGNLSQKQLIEMVLTDQADEFVSYRKEYKKQVKQIHKTITQLCKQIDKKYRCRCKSVKEASQKEFALAIKDDEWKAAFFWLRNNPQRKARDWLLEQKKAIEIVLKYIEKN